MSTLRPNHVSPRKNVVAADTKQKSVYVKPAFEHERVFETMALACGKVSATQSSCRFNRKNS